MNTLRRNVLKGASSASAVAVAVAAGLLKPTELLAAWNKPAFEAKTMDDAMKGLGASSPVDSKSISIKAPDIAENGAVVPVEVTSSLPGTTNISIFAEKNGTPLVGSFNFCCCLSCKRGCSLVGCNQIICRNCWAMSPNTALQRDRLKAALLSCP